MFSSPELPEAEWTCPAPPAATLGRGLALPAIPPCPRLSLGKDFSEPFIFREISTHVDWRPRVGDRQQSKGKY